MIVVLGWLRVDPEAREGYLEGCREAIAAARSAEGCLDFHLSADPLEPDRINVVEAWTSTEAVERFRGDGPAPDQVAALRGADVREHVVASSRSLTDPG